MQAGVNWVQMREKDLPGRELAAITARPVRPSPPVLERARDFASDRKRPIGRGAGGGCCGRASGSRIAERARRGAVVQKRECSAGISDRSFVPQPRGGARSGERGRELHFFWTDIRDAFEAGAGCAAGSWRVWPKFAGSVRIPVIAIGGVDEGNARSAFARVPRELRQSACFRKRAIPICSRARCKRSSGTCPERTPISATRSASGPRAVVVRCGRRLL